MRVRVEGARTWESRGAECTKPSLALPLRFQRDPGKPGESREGVGVLRSCLRPSNPILMSSCASALAGSFSLGRNTTEGGVGFLPRGQGKSRDGNVAGPAGWAGWRRASFRRRTTRRTSGRRVRASGGRLRRRPAGGASLAGFARAQGAGRPQPAPPGAARARARAALLGRRRDPPLVADDARARPGDLPVHRLGGRGTARSTTATSAT